MLKQSRLKFFLAIQIGQSFGLLTPSRIARQPSSLNLFGIDAFEDVHLPKSHSTLSQLGGLFRLNPRSNAQTLRYIFSKGRNDSLLGEEKRPQSLDISKQLLMETASLKNDGEFSNYKFFGDANKLDEQLYILLKTNPFMASALTEAPDGGFELKSFDPNERKPSRYLKYMRTLNGVGHKVNFKFDKNMKMESFTVYDDLEGKEMQGDLDVNYWASSALYNLLFYASCVHATIHVLHYLLTSGLQVSAKDYPGLNDWASYYERNIVVKYLEVAKTLISDAPKNNKFLDLSLLTGVDGFGSSQEIRPMLKDMLDEWGSNPSMKGFMECMFNISVPKMEKAGILTEFRKHAELIPEFASSVVGSLKSSPKKGQFDLVESKLQTYLSSCGAFKSNIDSLHKWIEIMGITGIAHGGTVSYTRLMAVPEVARWRNIKSQVWEEADINLVTLGLGTVTGVQYGRHVMTDKFRGAKRNMAFNKALQEYNDKTTELKVNYNKHMHEDHQRDFLDDFGFLLSDYCPDGFDGKQLTIATYI